MNTREDQTSIVERTWAIAAQAEGLSLSFYKRLFVTHPELHALLFGATDLEMQSRMMTQMLDAAVRNLRNDAVLVPALHDLGLRHCSYGVRPEHYMAVTEALVWALQQHIPALFTVEVKAAWQGVLAVIAAHMSAECFTMEGRARLATWDAAQQHRNTTLRAVTLMNVTKYCCVATSLLLAIAVGVFVQRRRDWTVAKG